jgi:hypothetical protein
MKRPLIGAFFFVSIFVAPLWVALLIGGLLLFLYPAWEVVIGAFLIDALFSTGVEWLPIPFPLTLISLVFLAALHPFRSLLLRS